MISILCLSLFIITTYSISAVTYSDADSDGVCEPGEEITFYGDPEFDYYDWDFNGDGLPDDNGEVVTYTFSEKGIYVVSVIETNGHTEQKLLIIEVKDDQEEPEPDVKDKSDKLEKKIEKILDRLNRNHVKINIIIKLLLKEYGKMERKDQICFDLGQALEFIKQNEK